MENIDLRTISEAAIKILRAKAIKEVIRQKNVSKVARELGINRQVLHGWVKQSENTNIFNVKKRGRPKQNLSKSDTHKVIHELYNNDPVDAGIIGAVWTISTVRELVLKVLGLNCSAYVIRQWLSECGFFKRREIGLFKEKLPEMGDQVVMAYSASSGFPCYIYWSACVSSTGPQYNFHCISSMRGDLRFIGKGLDISNNFLNKVQSVAKKKIIIVCGDGRISFDYRTKLSKNVILFQRKEWRLKRICS